MVISVGSLQCLEALLVLPRWYNAFQMQPTNDTEDGAHNNLQPDHPYVGIPEDTIALPPVHSSRLLDRRPYREPAKPQGETPGQRCDGHVILGDLLVLEVRGEEGDHDEPAGT